MELNEPSSGRSSLSSVTMTHGGSNGCGDAHDFRNTFPTKCKVPKYIGFHVGKTNKSCKRRVRYFYYDYRNRHDIVVRWVLTLMRNEIKLMENP